MKLANIPLLFAIIVGASFAAAMERWSAPDPMVISLDAPDAGSKVAQAGAPGELPPALQMPEFKCETRPCVVSAEFRGEVEPGDQLVISAFLDAGAKAKPDAYALVINSPGGSFEVSRLMYRRLSELDKPLFCFVQDNAQSAAFLILQACDVRIAAPEASLMIHEVKVRLEGAFGASDMEAIAEDLRVGNDIMATLIAPRMGISKAAFLARIARGDWTMSGSDAKKLKAVDSVLSGGPRAFYALIRSMLTPASPSAPAQPLSP